MARFLKKFVTSKITAKAKHEVSEELLILIERIVFASIVTLGFVISMGILNINLVTLLAALGVGIGFAFKDLFANFIAGVVILTQKKFKIGDLIKVRGMIGTITEIESRSTQLRSIDGTLLVVPNSEMLTEVVENYTAHSFRRITFQVAVHYATPLDLAVSTALAAVQKNNDVMPQPAPQVFVSEFAESSIALEVRFWVDSEVRNNWWIIQSEIIKEIKKDFDGAGIVIPFPIRTLALDPYDANVGKVLEKVVPRAKAVPKPV